MKRLRAWSKKGTHAIVTRPTIRANVAAILGVISVAGLIAVGWTLGARGDTHLTLHDTISDARFKVDMRIINDKIKQRHNIENEVSIMEAAEEYAGDAKLVFYRYSVKTTSIDS
ncbi:hypothetical protein CU097_004818 [Rhizopus azygosporus]|uniref:Uncharacterized protein n=1 Tax=Rhizopus azygosporus TaxID=86630 RepID=A0A367J1M6_RHIAZ|nr:hypothetical protein CU097_004818 [Rhizopus azygosporus]